MKHALAGLALAAACGPAGSPASPPVSNEADPRPPPSPRAPAATTDSVPIVSVPTAPAGNPAPDVSPLAADALEELPLGGHFLPAVVAPPVGATTRQPIWVAAHGAGGKASIHCQRWRNMLPAGRGFVLCPRGFPTHPQQGADAPGFYYDGHPRLAEEVQAAVVALRGRWSGYVDDEGPVFAGYSQGASMGALALPGHAARFTRVLLWEGGSGEHQEWNLRVARRLRRDGTLRVLFACGRPVCREHAVTSAGYLRREGIEAEVLFVSGAGHTYRGELAEAVASRLPWLLAGDLRWAPL